MPFIAPFVSARLHCAPVRLAVAVAVVLSAVLAIPVNAGAQQAAGASAVQAATPTMLPALPKASAPLLSPKPAGLQWSELSPAQKQILQPLAASWDTLSSEHKSKWIALAHSYPRHTPAEQEKMQSRMLEWAALTPTQRTRARLNFAETKKLSASERAANWEAYQGLSSQEKRNLADKGKRKLPGAAIAVTLVPPEKMTPVVVTRHTPPPNGGTPAVRSRINPDTLLPLPPTAPPPALVHTSAPH